MKKRPWLKQAGIVLCIVMAVLIAVTFRSVRRRNEAEREELRRISKAYEETMRPLWNEKARLEREIAEQEKLVAAETPSPVMLLCTEPDKRLLDDVYPIAEQYGYTAAIVLSEELFPGETGCLTESDMEDLLDQGWELCLGADAQTDLAALCQRVADAGLPKPVAVYYPNGTVQMQEVQALGIHAVIRYGKNAAEGDTEGIYLLPAYGSMESDSKTVFQTMARNAAPLVLTVGYSNSRELFSETNYSNMLKTINSYEKTSNVKVGSIRDAYSAYAEAQSGAFDEPETEAQRHLAELKAELSAVNEKLWSMG